MKCIDTKSYNIMRERDLKFLLYNFLNKRDSTMIRYNFGGKCMVGQTKGLS